MRRALMVALVLMLALVGCGGGGHHLHGGRHHSTGFGKPPHGDYGLHQKHVGVSPLLLGFDAVTNSNIPAGTAVVGCYNSGPFQNCGEARARFPHAYILTIATYAGASGRCLDTEPGDAVPSQDPGWVRRMIQAGIHAPCIYADAAEMGQVRAYMVALPRASYKLWLADWDNSPTIPAGYDAKQYASNCCVDRDSFASTFFSSPPKPHPVCFGRRATGSATCRQIHGRVRSLETRRAGQLKAYATNHRISVARRCPVLSQRVRWYESQLKHHPRIRTAARRRALHASRVAYRQRKCSTWQHRDAYFAGAAARTDAQINHVIKLYS